MTHSASPEQTHCLQQLEASGRETEERSGSKHDLEWCEVVTHAHPTEVPTPLPHPQSLCSLILLTEGPPLKSAERAKQARSGASCVPGGPRSQARQQRQSPSWRRRVEMGSRPRRPDREGRHLLGSVTAGGTGVQCPGLKLGGGCADTTQIHGCGAHRGDGTRDTVPATRQGQPQFADRSVVTSDISKWSAAV